MKKTMTALVLVAMAYGRASAQEGEAPVTAEPAVGESEQQALEKDMEQGHAKVLESAPTEQAPPAIQTQTPQEEVRGPTRREGTTFEFGLGLHYTSEYIDPDHRVGGAFGASIGWFLDRQTALLLRFVASSIAQNDREVVFAAGQDRSADRFHGISTFFLGPQLQYFPIDRFMIAAGVGFAGRLETVRVAVEDVGDLHNSTGWGGFGASVRAGVTVYQRQDKAALRIGLEAVPTYLDSDWNISTGLIGELQIF